MFNFSQWLCLVRPQGQIGVLTMENEALIEKLAVEESRSKELPEKSQVPFTLFISSSVLSGYHCCCVDLDLWPQSMCKTVLLQSLTTLALVPTEGLPHSISGAGAREPQSSAGYQKQTAPPAGNEADGAPQTGQTWGRWKQFWASFWDKQRMTKNSAVLIYFSFPERKKCEVGWEPSEGPARERGPQSSHGSSRCTVKVRVPVSNYLSHFTLFLIHSCMMCSLSA